MTGNVMDQYTRLCSVYNGILISAIFAVRKLVKRRFSPKSAIRLSIVMLHCSYVSPSDSDQGFFFTAALRVVGCLEPNWHIFRLKGEEGAIENRDIIMKCKLEYCFYYKAKQMRLCCDSHQRCLCDD